MRQFPTTIQMFEDRSTVLDPVARVSVGNLFDLLNGRRVDVTANDRFAVAISSVLCDLTLEVAYEVYSTFETHFDLAAVVPLRESAHRSNGVDAVVRPKQELIQRRANDGEPLALLFDFVEFIPVHDQHVTTV